MGVQDFTATERGSMKRFFELLTRGSLLFFVLTVAVMFAVHLLEWSAWVRPLGLAAVGAFFIYFLGAAVLACAEMPGWKNRLLPALSFVFLGLFVGFIVLMILADALYVNSEAIRKVFHDENIRNALWLSVWTSVTATAFALLFAVPIGYTLSRARFPGRVWVDAVVDLPFVFPPLVTGLTLLVFFAQTSFGRFIESDAGLGWKFVFQPAGIVLCQFVVTATLAARSAKTAFDSVDRRLENVALTLGCSRWGVFFRVTMPLARNGILAGGILTWAHAFGLFGPLMLFVGSFRGRTEVLPTTIFLEQSVGNIEVALTVALLLIGFAAAFLAALRLLGRREGVR
jgi:molybdate transport system permease protein